MKNTIHIIFFASVLLFSGDCFAIGGNGATCNPSTVNWGSCSLATIPWEASVTNTVNVAGGTWASPYAANAANTKYVLQGDATANSAGFVVSANYVVIDLNGHTLTYNQTAAGEGVTVGSWNLNHIAVINGTILQGDMQSAGDQYGQGGSPVATYNTALSGNRPTDYLHIANLHVEIGGKDLGGIVVTSNNAIIEENTITDNYQFGTLANRHQGNDAITASKGETTTGSKIRYNTIDNCRHRGIQVSNGEEIYGNHITTRTIAVNGYGILAFGKHDFSIHDNTVISRGSHPIGIGAVEENMSNAQIYNNYLDSKTTAIDDEYSSSYLDDQEAVITGNYAVGFRTTWGGNGINFHDNEIHVSTNSYYTGVYSPTGDIAYINAGGRGLMIGVDVGETATFRNNIISVLDEDGTGNAFGISCCNNTSDAVYFINNTVTSNVTNIVLGDEYGACGGYPLFSGNTLIKSGSHAGYKTFTTQLGGYTAAQARVVETTYQGGAAEESVGLNPDGNGVLDVYFGVAVNNEYLYNYRLHDNNGASSTLLREDFDPAITLGYSNPPAAGRRYAVRVSTGD